jgi:ribosomal protein S18 acetylase RimI-like enzyme
VEIRILTERDAQTLWDLRMRAVQTEPGSFVDSPEELRSISAEEFASRLRANSPENFVIAAFEQRAALGMIGFYRELPLKRRHKGWIWGVFVAPEARRRGIALTLMQEAIARARSLPDLEIILLTVSVNQPAPRNLYTSLGFRSIGIEPKGLKIGNEHIDEEHLVLNLYDPV